MKTKSINFTAKAFDDSGTFGGYCSVFNVKDSYGDVVKKGAFTQSLADWQAKGKMPPILWQHNSGEVIGVWTKLHEDEHGLYGEGKLFIDDIARAKEAHALMKHGAIDGLSIGYFMNKWSYDEKNETLELQALDLREVSVVTFPANADSRIDTVKSTLEQGKLPTLSEFEKFLREAGFSKSQACAIASHGLRKLLGEQAKSNDSTDVEQALAILNNINLKSE